MLSTISVLIQRLVCIIKIKSNVNILFLFQAKEWVNVTLQPKESTVSQRWILLEEKKRWENYKGRPHEIESPRNRGRIIVLPSFG